VIVRLVVFDVAREGEKVGVEDGVGE